MAIASSLLAPTSGLGKELTLKIAVTSDVHGNYFPYNFITRSPGDGSQIGRAHV